VEESRAAVSRLAGARPNDLIFTSGGSEANALALYGAVYGAAEAGERITRMFVSAIEHDSILANATALTERMAGLRLEILRVSPNGAVEVDALRTALREGKGRALVAVMAANNETGVIQPLSEIAQLAAECGALLVVDAVQAAGKIPIKLDAIGADYLSLSAHKLGGPQGVGALVVRGNVPFTTFIAGGGQERGRRAGTENVAGIAGFGAVAESRLRALDVETLGALRDHFERELREAFADVIVFGEGARRLPNTSNFAIPGLPAETALMALDLDGVMVSSGAACSSGKVSPSHVLAAMGVTESLARCALRVSLGWNSEQADVDAAIASLAKLRARVSARAA
jgi:cysteine desulfurase